MVDVLAEESVVVENGQLRGLVNRRTGGRLHYDILLAESKVALEFQGPQHEGPTDLYPGAPQFEALRERDQLKRVLSAKQGIRLVEVRAADLSFARLAELLAAAGVRLKANPQKRWHMYDLLTSESDRFRERAEYISYPVSISVPSGPSQAALHTLA